MIQKQHHLTKIYKKVLLIISAFLIIGSTYSLNTAIASEFGEVQYNNNFIDYTKVDKEATRKLADYYFEKALYEEEKSIQKDYLQKASGEYFVLTQIEPKNLYPIVQIARVYDLENENSYAKAYFYQALNINQNDARTNYYFGEYYYKRHEYTRAIYFYNVAFKNGWEKDFEILVKMGEMYEKLGDLHKAKKYYIKACSTEKKYDEKLLNKIRNIENLNYKNTGYYWLRKRK